MFELWKCKIKGKSEKALLKVKKQIVDSERMSKSHW